MDVLAVDQRSVRGRGKIERVPGTTAHMGCFVLAERFETCGNAQAKEVQ